jgi:hypothetical protein
VFDIRQSIEDRHGEFDEGKARRYTEHLIEEFAESPEGQALAERVEDNIGGWVDLMFEYYFNYIGGHPVDMTTGDLQEVLFELFPRKVSTEPDSAPEIVAELRAFWQFLGRQYQLGSAAGMVALLDDRAEHRLRKELADPRNFGMAKSFFTQGQAAGFDMTTERGLQEFMALYNASRMGMPMPPPGMLGGDDEEDFDDEDGDLPPGPPLPLSPKQKAKKRKERKAKREARKRNRRK